ncbi:MAG TPA: hypothetical protein PKA05_23000 [Roseiflexaceae bacterium]|nr:hypothetical protein [Roseiflexaceae bacterium]HMP43261.1 hypothetical protein [Roseiflexaceae bacterium]
MLIDLQIDELILRGFSNADPRRVARAMAHELARLVAVHGPVSLAADGNRVIAALDTESLRLPADARPERIGAALARVVWDAREATHE